MKQLKIPMKQLKIPIKQLKIMGRGVIAKRRKNI